PDQDAGVADLVALHEGALGADVIARPAGQLVKAMRSSLCACCTPTDSKFSRIMWAKSTTPASRSAARRLPSNLWCRQCCSRRAVSGVTSHWSRLGLVGAAAVVDDDVGRLA